MNTKSSRTRKQFCSRMHPFLRNTNENINVNINERTKLKVERNRNCLGCQDDTLKLLIERMAKIETIVNDLAKLTKEFNSNTKVTINKSKFLDGVDLSSCKLEDLQEIITKTTNSMTSNIKRKFCEEPKECESSSHKIPVYPKKNPGRSDSGYYSGNDNVEECKE